MGRAIALDFASKGANVAIVYLDHRVQAQQVLNELKALEVEAEEHATDVRIFPRSRICLRISSSVMDELMRW